MDLEELIDKDNIKIKSIVIEKLDFNTIISNNTNPYAVSYTHLRAHET